MKSENEYFKRLARGVNFVNLQLLREDGVSLTIEEATFLAELDIPNETDIILLPDNSKFEIRPLALALLEFLIGWNIAPHYMKLRIGLQKAVVAKKAFTKFYPELLNRFPALLDSPHLFKL